MNPTRKTGFLLAKHKPGREPTREPGFMGNKSESPESYDTNDYAFFNDDLSRANQFPISTTFQHGKGR